MRKSFVAVGLLVTLGLVGNPPPVANGRQLQTIPISEIAPTVDVTSQPVGPARAHGPFPDSNCADHSPCPLPIKLELLVPTGQPSPEGTMLVNFLIIITNISPARMRLLFSIRQPTANIKQQPFSMMTLWLTSDAIRPQYVVDQRTSRLFRFEAVATSAELYGLDDDPQSFVVLSPNGTMLIHASSRVQLNPGRHSITAHAELLSISQGTSQLVGAADAETVAKTLSKATR